MSCWIQTKNPPIPSATSASALPRQAQIVASRGRPLISIAASPRNAAGGERAETKNIEPTLGRRALPP
ncbi:hypothetical protein KCP77_05115 [Salmonella enterica subsp. enterica]|nr:hypothetical protein KCP77_05115 [Salmonella enterica subsp. enterica]